MKTDIIALKTKNKDSFYHYKDNAMLSPSVYQYTIEYYF